MSQLAFLLHACRYYMIAVCILFQNCAKGKEFVAELSCWLYVNDCLRTFVITSLNAVKSL